MLCNDSEDWETIWCVVELLLLQRICVSRVAPLLFTSSFHPQFHFSRKDFSLTFNSLKTKVIILRKKPRKLAISDKMELSLLAPLIMSHSKSPKSLFSSWISKKVHWCTSHLTKSKHFIRKSCYYVSEHDAWTSRSFSE